MLLCYTNDMHSKGLKFSHSKDLGLEGVIENGSFKQYNQWNPRNLLIEAEWSINASEIYPSLVQIMACHLGSTKPLSEPMLEYC